jgi:hypothetical protein
MLKSLNRFTPQIRYKLYCLSFGLTAGIGVQILSQGCVTSGQ